ncbi:MAG: hypothetical protein QOJ43_2312, partial [Gaiellaceae bacterium]|nr:hypothetical protein [Gaiellaceae bacterium]
MDVVRQPLDLIAQSTSGLIEDAHVVETMRQLLVADAHSPDKSHCLGAAAVSVGCQRRQLPVALGKTLLGCNELRPLLLELGGHTRVTPQLSVTVLELGVARTHPLDEAGHLGSPLVPLGRDCGQLPASLGELLLGGGELNPLRLELARNSIPALELGLEPADPLNEAAGLGAPPIALERERSKRVLSLSETPLGTVELTTMVVELGDNPGAIFVACPNPLDEPGGLRS